MTSRKDETESSAPASTSGDELFVLVEIVGATNVYAPSEAVVSSSMRDLKTVISGSSFEEESQTGANAVVVVSTFTSDKKVVLHKTKCKLRECHPIWTIHDDCLFVMKIDDRQPPLTLDVLHEDNNKKKSISIGQAVIDPLTLLQSCQDEKRVELTLRPPDDERTVNATQLLLQQKQHHHHMLEFQRVNDKYQVDSCIRSPKICVRFRIATDDDLLFCKHLKQLQQAGISDLRNIPTPYEKLLYQRPSARQNKMTLAKCITEKNEVKVGYKNVMDTFSRVTTHLNTNKSRIKVKPGPDPQRPQQTTHMSESQMNTEMQKPSTNWVHCGSQSQQQPVGQVYLEILNCQGLPNMDVGVGNFTDSFVVAILEDAMMQTPVIDDILSPMWMPWTQRAFIFDQKHPNSQLYLGVFDYDFGSDHDGIGRVVINLNSLAPNVLHVLQYNLYPSSNITDRSADFGTITIRLRRTIHSERAYLLAAINYPDDYYINVTKQKSQKVVNYTLWGANDPNKFDVTLLRSYVNEIFEIKANTTYAIQNAFYSLIFWKGQVRVPYTTNFHVPLHSLLVYTSALYLVDRPHLLPGFFFLSLAWIILVNLSHRTQHPSPWHRVHTTLMHYISILIYDKRPVEYMRIYEKEGWKETQQYHKHWVNRMEQDAKLLEQQQQQEQQMLQEQEEVLQRFQPVDMHTKEANATLKTPMDLVMDKLEPYLFPQQLRLAAVCRFMREIKGIFTWDDAPAAFWSVILFTAIGIVLLALPTVYVLQKALKCTIFFGMGPWMRFLDSKTENYNDYSTQKKKQKSYQNHLYKLSLFARIQQEESCKLKAMRHFRYGPYMSSVNIHPVRHVDIPLCDSMALHQSLVPSLCSSITPSLYAPSQTLTGNMIHSTSKKTTSSPSELNRQKRHEYLLQQWTNPTKIEKEETVANKDDDNDNNNTKEGEDDGNDHEVEETSHGHETVSTVTACTTPLPNNDNDNIKSTPSDTISQAKSIDKAESEDDTLAVSIPVKHVLTQPLQLMMPYMTDLDEQRHDSVSSPKSITTTKSSLGKRMEWNPPLHTGDENYTIEIDDYDDLLLSPPYEHSDDEEGIEVVPLEDDDEDENDEENEDCGACDNSTILSSTVYQSTERTYITFLHKNKMISTVPE